MDMDMPQGTIVFTTIGRPHYGFDVFSTPIPLTPSLSEHRLTDGVSVNFNAQFVDDHLHGIVYVSERNGFPQIYLGSDPDHPLPSAPASLFHDRPIVKHGRLFFISAHQPTDAPFKSCSALYTIQLDDGDGTLSRLTPDACVDYSPSLSQSGDLVAVASYGSRPWSGEFHHLKTDIVVFRLSDPSNRFLLSSHGGWPTWSGDSTIYFHRQADDGWWSIFRLDLDLPSNFANPSAPRRVTPPGLHCFTPAAMHHRQQIAVATRRKGETHRHIEIFDVELNKFYPITKLLNPNIHHYNPFVSPNSGFLGYHRFRGESSDGESIIPNLDPVSSPIKGLKMLRLNGAFPSFSPSGDLIAFNPDLVSNGGIDIVKSDGSQRWSILEGRASFYNAWSPMENNVIFTSIGPIFSPVKTTVQIARISFDLQGETKPEIKILTKEETGNNAFPSCSPDGKSLVFRSGRSGHKNLNILDAMEGEFKGDGGGIRQVTEGPWIDTMPSWSPDGNLIAFSSNRHNPENTEAFSIYVMSPDGSNVRRIFVAGSEGSEEVDRERINHVCFSADCEWLLFTTNIGGVTAEPVSLPNQFQPYGDLHVCRLDGSGLQRLTWNGYENGTPAWHPKTTLGLGLGLGLDTRSIKVGNKLLGEFDEPLWIKSDF